MTTGIEQAGTVRAGERATAARAAVAARPRPPGHRAPFSLRCGALLVDYTLVVGVLAFSTLLARMLGGAHTSSDLTLAFGYVSSAALAAFNFLLLPVFTGRTLGKWATGLRVEMRDGRRLSFGRALLRHTAGYLASLLTLGVGFLLAAFSREGRGLHDIIAGTVVVRE